MKTEAQIPAPIYSEFGRDSDLADLVVMFVDEIGGRIDEICRAFEKSDLQTVETLSHQLKGAAGSYGFHELTPAAFQVESAARQHASRDLLSEQIQNLVELCSRVRAGGPA